MCTNCGNNPSIGEKDTCKRLDFQTQKSGWLCSRSRVYAAAQAWQSGRRPGESLSGSGSVPLPRSLTLGRRRSLLALLLKAPSV
jgi:hypothetical protein